MLTTLLHSMSKIPARIKMLITFASNSILNYAFGIAIGWLLVPGDFGLVGFAQTIILIAGILLNSGLAWSLTAQIAEAPDDNRMALTRGALLANIILAFILIAAVLGLYSLGILRAGLETWAIAGVVVLSFPFLSIIAIVNGAVRGVEAFGSLAIIKVSEVAFKAIGGIFLAYIGLGAFGALLGFTLGSVIAATFGLVRTGQLLEDSFIGEIQFPSWRLTGDLFAALFGMALLLNLDILFVKTFAGEYRELAGYYQSAIMLANTPYYMTTALLGVLFPQLARKPDIRKSLAPVTDTLKMIIVFFIPFEIGLLIAPEAILSLVFPSEFIVAAPFMQILALGNISLIMTALLSTTFQATHHARIPAFVLISVTIMEGVALYMFVPQYQGIAAATIFGAACTIAFLAQLLVYFYYVRDIEWQRLLVWSGKYIVALALAVGSYQLLRTLTDQFLLSAISGMFIYIAVASLASIMPLPAFLATRLTNLTKA